MSTKELTVNSTRTGMFSKFQGNRLHLIPTSPIVERDQRSRIIRQIVNDNPNLVNAINFVYDDVEVIENGPKNLGGFHNGDHRRNKDEWRIALGELKNRYQGYTVFGIEYSTVWQSRGHNLEWDIVDYSQWFNQIRMCLDVSDKNPEKTEVCSRYLRDVYDIFLSRKAKLRFNLDDEMYILPSIEEILEGDSIYSRWRTIVSE